MSIFDAYIKKAAEYIETMQASGRRVMVFDCSGDKEKLLNGLPVRVGPGAGSGLVLRGDTFLELGSPEVASCAFPLWTNNTELIRDCRITLIGPDIPESAGASLPFGQVIIAAGERLSDKHHAALDEGQYVSDQIEGYMVKSTPGRMWTRVSNKAAEKGFGFEALGRALISIYRSRVPEVEKMEVIFVTSGREDVQQLEDTAVQVRKIGKDIIRKNWLDRGYDILECTFGWDCNSCPDKPTCDDIKELIKVRKKNVPEPTEGN